MAGSLCLVDQVPRTMSNRELDQLRMLGATTASLLNQYQTAGAMRNLSVELVQASEIVERQRQELRAQKRFLDCASDLAKIGAWEVDCKTGELLWSDGMYALHEVDKTFKPSLDSLEQFYPPEDFARLMEQVAPTRPASRRSKALLGRLPTNLNISASERSWSSLDTVRPHASPRTRRSPSRT